MHRTLRYVRDVSVQLDRLIAELRVLPSGAAAGTARRGPSAA